MTQIRDSDRNAGDVGRRIIDRRHELNLSIDEVAERAGMAVGYFDYIEHTPIAELTPSALRRVALALEVSVPDLLGGEHGRAHGSARAATDTHLVKIEDAECRELLRQGGVGRVVFRSGERPVAIPLNFKTLNGDVVFRSAETSEIAAIAPVSPVSFEVDRIDDAMSEGWSVLATGTVRAILATEEIEKVSTLDIEPWAGGDRRTYFRLCVTELTGRRIVVDP
jgi:nitroimidazol reductase NimA-like FMN-containing flavoprotein (pyridoxamine 5'-phosphate oxidase superfamily)